MSVQFNCQNDNRYYYSLENTQRTQRSYGTGRNQTFNLNQTIITLKNNNRSKNTSFCTPKILTKRLSKNKKLTFIVTKQKKTAREDHEKA
jgi:hypothetical protein